MRNLNKALIIVSVALISTHSAVPYKQIEQVAINVQRLPKINTIIQLPDVVIKAPKPETSFECLRKNLYFEAGNQGRDGMIAVANVVMNRVHNPAYPNKVCDVVYQGNGQRYKCQFSWYCDGKPDRVNTRNKAVAKVWTEAGEIAHLALKGRVKNLVDDATNYHADYIKQPNWNFDKLQKIAIIGRHIFYRELVAASPE